MSFSGDPGVEQDCTRQQKVDISFRQGKMATYQMGGIVTMKAGPYLRLYRKTGEYNVHFFEASVLDPYRENPDYRF